MKWQAVRTRFADKTVWRDLLLIALFAAVYFAWFFALEARATPYYILHARLDDIIPFCEYFLVPYFLWFPFVFLTLAYFFVFSPKDFARAAAFCGVGMVACLLIYTFFPNGQDLRPVSFPRENLFTDGVRRLYQTDTPTNVFPSMHVFNTLGMQIALCHSEKIKKKRLLICGTLLLSLLIILSTVMLKQHSILDAYAAIALAVPLYVAVYRRPRWAGRILREK